MTTATEATELLASQIYFYGGNQQVMECRDPEILAVGPAGSGKTIASLTKIHTRAQLNPGYKALIVRKTLISLTNSSLVSFQEKVLHPAENVKFFGGSKARPAAFNYPNGSSIAVGGMDDPTKILSTEYDDIYFNESTEASLEDWETLTSRLRNGKTSYSQLLGDCNPSYDSHWLYKRCQAGKTTLITCHLEDNPAYYNRDGTPTEAGSRYLATLDALTGDRYRRLRLGEWVGLENGIYSGSMDPNVHLAEIPKGTYFDKGAIGIDFGQAGGHLSTVVTVAVDSTGVIWVKECIDIASGEPDDIKSAVKSARFRSKGMALPLRTDPTTYYAAKDLHGSTAERADRARNGRVAMVKQLLGARPAAIKFDKKGRGIPELWDEMQSYHWLIPPADSGKEPTVDRVHDDRIAGMEYAIEELQGPNIPVLPSITSAPRSKYHKFRVGAA